MSLQEQHDSLMLLHHWSTFRICSDSLRPRLLDIDDFIENLWKIHVQVKSEGYVQVSLIVWITNLHDRLTQLSPYNLVFSDPTTWSTSIRMKALNPA